MYLVQDKFRCKPGKSSQVADMFKNSLAPMKSMKGFKNGRVLVDYIASYWTVMLEFEVEDLAAFEAGMTEFRTHPEMRKAMAGYMDLVEGGNREVYKIL